MKQEFDIQDEWVSYEIHPETPPEGRPVGELFGGADLGPMHDMLRARAAEFGLPFAPPQLLSNSRLAILAAEYARDRGRFPEFSRRVFSAYFGEGRNIGDIEVLLGAAQKVGLDPEDLRRSLLAGENVDRLRSAESDARRLGITGVPTFFISGTPAGDPESPAQTPAPSRRIVGAQPLEVFRQAILNP